MHNQKLKNYKVF